MNDDGSFLITYMCLLSVSFSAIAIIDCYFKVHVQEREFQWRRVSLSLLLLCNNNNIILKYCITIITNSRVIPHTSKCYFFFSSVFFFYINPPNKEDYPYSVTFSLFIRKEEERPFSPNTKEGIILSFAVMKVTFYHHRIK